MAKSLRTLLLECYGSVINFKDFESLHVLRLEDYGIEESSSIRKLIHLRYFDISGTAIEYLPDWIGEFFHLQTLRVDSEYLRKLPSTIKYLINLRHLYIGKHVDLLPAGIGRLTSLQTLNYFPVGDENGCKIEELRSLNNLKGELEILHLERVHDKEEAAKANLFKNSKILQLCLEWDEESREGERNDENVLEGLQPHSDLKELEIRGFNGCRFPLMASRMEYLPDWIGEFFHLQTLRVSSYKLRKLPSTIKYLINLRHLYIHRDAELPMGIGRLTSLQTLKYFPVGDENGCKIEELGSLNDLKGELEIRNLERVHGKEEAAKANLIKKSKILNLCLKWKGGRREGERNDENVLEGLQSHSYLKKLTIDGFNGSRFPLWIQKMAVRDVPGGFWVELNKLMSLYLFDCRECEEIPMLGQLPNLKSLVLRELSNVKCINSSFYGMVNKDTRIVFPVLEKLILNQMPKLVEWAEIEVPGGSEVKVFPRLQHLEIRYCNQLMNVPMLGHLPDLKSLNFDGLSNVKCINSSFYGMVNKDTHIVFPALEKLILYGMPKLVEWAEIEVPGGSEVKLFPRLQHLEIKRCEQLMSVPSRVSSCLQHLEINGTGLECIPADWLFSNNQTLSELDIRWCPNLRELGDRDSGGEQSQPSFTSLRVLFIDECEALEYLPCEMLGFSLEELWLRKLSSLKNLPRVFDSLPKSPRLKKLSITGVPKFMGNCYVEIPRFPNLRYVDLDVSMSSMEAVDGILQGCCHSLHWLFLKGMESWECLPESIQHLTALSFLRLVNFGMEELPEWFGNFSSLERLDLGNCKRLRRLPSMDAMQRLTTLQQLFISNCPELVIKSEAADSEWPKVSHIPRIIIDCHYSDTDADVESRTKKQLCLGCL